MMIEYLTVHYPNYDWSNMEGSPIVYISGTGEYRVLTHLWPTSTYPTIPTSDEIKGWL